MIRIMQNTDVDIVVQIEKSVQTHPWSRQQFVESLNSYQCTVIESQNRVVGFCILQPVLDEANLLLMAVDPKMQGQGLGYELLNASIDQLKNQPVQIFLEVRESNKAAIGLYEKNRFSPNRPSSQLLSYPRRGREHAVIMVKTCTDDFASLF